VVTVSSSDFHVMIDKSRAFRRAMQAPHPSYPLATPYAHVMHMSTPMSHNATQDLVKQRRNQNISVASQTRVFGRSTGALSVKAGW
jgi:hypothetical protein